MSVISAVGSFALVAGLVTVIPGLDTAMVLRAALNRGYRSAFLTALGIGTGSLVWGIAAAVGVSALLTASTVAYTALRIAGAGYMLWLGVRMIRGAWITRSTRDNDAPPEAGIEAGNDVPELGGTPSTPREWGSWRQGLFTNLLNPKVGAFYLSVLPQFIPAHVDPLMMGVLLALVHDVEGMLWFTLIIVGARRARAWLARRRVRRTADGLTGAVLVGFGLKLGFSSH